MNFDTKPLPQQQRHQGSLPWVIVGVIVVLALVASALVIHFVRNQQQSDSARSSQTAPAETEGEGSASSNQNDEEESSSQSDDVPMAEVGGTFQLRITQWDQQVALSHKLGGVRYELKSGPDRVVLSADLINQLPASCAQMREEFGFLKTASGKFEVLKPQQVCKADRELYNEIWGLLDAAAKTAAAL